MRRFVRYGSAAAVGVVATAAAMAATTAQATPNKPYAANVHQTLDTPGSFTLTVTNDPNASQSLGSANFTPPSGFVLGAVSNITNAGFNVSVVGNVVQFRAKSSAQALGKGGTVSADVTVTSGIAGCASAKWIVEAKQSNDFSGTPGNDLNLDPASDLTPLGSFEIADLGTTIRTQNGDVFAPAILTTPPSPTPYSSTTTAYDTCHNVKTDYSGATVDENNTLLEASFEPSGGQTLSWASGIGTLKISATISETDNTITVEDETTGISDTSNPFDTQQRICTSNDVSCSWHNDDGSINARASGPAHGSLGVGFNPDVTSQPCTGAPLGGAVTTIAPHGVDATYQVTLVYSKQISGNGPANAFVVCESTDDGAHFNPLHACSTFTAPLPDCIVDQKRVTGGALQIILSLNGDPYVGTDH